MCGITGYICLNKDKKISSKQLKNMTKIIRHRGPDDTGYCMFDLKKGIILSQSDIEDEQGMVCDGAVSCVRLSIRDRSVYGHQPMVTDDNKIILVYNGELYNTEMLEQLL